MKMHMESMEDPSIDVSSLIDMVFLLLVYFIVTASLQKSEADLGIRLPGMVAAAQQVDLPDEQMIEIRATGHVVLNDLVFDTPESTNLPELVATLTRYRLSSEQSQNVAMVTLAAEDEALHQRVIDVMNACATAGIKNVTFSMSEESP